MWTGSKNFTIVLLGVIISGATPISTPNSWVHESLTVIGTKPYIEHCFRVCTNSWRTLPQPYKVLPPSWHCNWIFKRPFNHSIMSDGSGWPDHGKTSEFHELRPINVYNFLWSSLIIMWNTMKVDKAFYESKNSSFGRSIPCKASKSVASVSVYYSKNKLLTLPS